MFAAAIDFDLMKAVLNDILHCRIAKVPRYNFVTNSRENEYDTIYPADVVIVEGILAFYDPEIRSLFQLKIFVEADSDTRLCRRGKYTLQTEIFYLNVKCVKMCKIFGFLIFFS